MQHLFGRFLWLPCPRSKCGDRRFLSIDRTTSTCLSSARHLLEKRFANRILLPLVVHLFEAAIMRKPSLLVSVALFVATLLFAIVRAEAQTKQALTTKPLTLVPGPTASARRTLSPYRGLCGRQTLFDGGNQGNGYCRAHAGADDETA